ncbi:MAG: Ig-like domain-containing protein [Actinomycetota bacterium]
MRLVTKTRLVGILAAIVAFASLGAPAAMAASITVTDLTSAGSVIGSEVRKAVFGLNMTDASGTATFNGLELQLTDVGGDGDFDLTLLSDLAGSPSGLAVYRDDGATADELDGDDTNVSTFTHDGSGGVTLSVASTIPAAAEGSYTYFVAVETSAGIANGDDFTVGIPSIVLGCAFDATGTSFLNCPSPDTTETITADTVAPTAVLTSPPVATTDDLVWTFSEDVFGVSTDNVVLRLDLSSVNLGAAVTYSATTDTATLNPTDDLTPGAAYDTIVNPASASTLVVDEAGNPVANTSASFEMADLGFTPGVVRGNFWLLNEGYDPFHEEDFLYGSSGDTVIVGDWNGDGTFTPGIVRGNKWFLNNNTDANADAIFFYGSSTDRPVVGDWDGNGTWTPGVVRGNLWLLNNGTDANADLSFRYGLASDRPVVGDWDGNLEYTPGIIRGNVWHINDGIDAFADESFAYGRSTDNPVVGDWDGDGVSSPGVVRGNQWFLANDIAPHATLIFFFGSSSDIAIAGDWDGSIEAAGASPGLLPKVLPGA